MSTGKGMVTTGYKIPVNGVAFRAMRKRARLTQATVAKWFGVDEQTVRRWENGKTELNRSAAVLMWLVYDEKVNHNLAAMRDFIRAKGIALSQGTKP